MRSTIDMYRRRQMQMEMGRDFHLRNQILLEQQMQQHAEVALAQQQQELLLPPSLARHRQLQQLEALQQLSPGVAFQKHQQLEAEALSRQSVLNREQIRPRRLTPRDETNSLSRASNSQYQPQEQKRKSQEVDAASNELGTSQFSPQKQSHLEGHSSGRQRQSHSEGRPVHSDGIADILEKIKRKEAEDRLIEVLTKRSLPASQNARSSLESYGGEAEQDRMQYAAANKPSNLHSSRENQDDEPNVPFVSKGASEEVHMEAEQGDFSATSSFTSSFLGPLDNQAKYNAVPSDDKEKIRSFEKGSSAYDTRSIAALIAKLQESPLTSSHDKHVDFSPSNGAPLVPMIHETAEYECMSMSPTTGAERTQLMRHLENEANVSLEEDASEDESEEQSEEDVDEQLQLSCYPEDDMTADLSTHLISAVPLVISEDDSWWPNDNSILRERRTRYYSASKNVYSGSKVPSLVTRLKADPEVSVTKSVVLPLRVAKYRILLLFFAALYFARMTPSLIRSNRDYYKSFHTAAYI